MKPFRGCARWGNRQDAAGSRQRGRDRGMGTGDRSARPQRRTVWATCIPHGGTRQPATAAPKPKPFPPGKALETNKKSHPKRPLTLGQDRILRCHPAWRDPSHPLTRTNIRRPGSRGARPSHILKAEAPFRSPSEAHSISAPLPRSHQRRLSEKGLSETYLRFLNGFPYCSTGTNICQAFCIYFHVLIQKTVLFARLFV